MALQGSRSGKTAFAKAALTYDAQVELLLSRGMRVDDVSVAKFYLQHLNYYRLAAYWLPFESDHTTHAFRPGTKFGDVLRLYVFDRELRLLLLDAIERVEVSVRAQWAYRMAHEHGPHAHLDKSLARSVANWHSNVESLRREVARADERFVRHFMAAYEEPLPPIWAVCEVMSLGLLSKWYDNLKPKSTRSRIASVFGVDEAQLASWLRHLTSVRNVCAHHSRLWNREFTVTPEPPRSKPVGPRGQWQVDSRNIFNALLILLHFMDVVAPAHTWRQRVLDLLETSAQSTSSMGFPDGWKALPIWSTERTIR
ncbi:MAG: Abi family protein [Gemmatimonadaceae bacterium]|nr:Abi family protein [Gemmatimonadaceae bacterium]